MKKNTLTLFLAFTLTVTFGQVAQFPQVYYNGQGTGGFSLLIRQSASLSSPQITSLATTSKIGAVALITNSGDPSFMNWIQVCLPGTTGSVIYGYMPCDEFYARINEENNYATVTTTTLNIRTGAGTTFPNVTIGGVNATLGNNSVLALTGNSSNISGIVWYQIHLTTNCNQLTGWVSSGSGGAFLAINSNTVNYRNAGGRICNNASDCNFLGNINGASINFSNIGSTLSSGGFYQYKLPISWSGSITCTHPAYTSSSPSFYSYTATGHNYTKNFILSNPCATPSAPTNLTVVSATSNSVTLSWNSSGSGVNYEILKNITSCNSAFGSSGLTTTNTSGTVTGLSPGTQYYFVGTATNGCGTSPNSNCITATTSSASQTGSVNVTILPAGAVSAGSQWNLDGQLPWQNSGATISAAIGSHTINFNTVSGWTPPASQNITVTTNNTINVTGTYSPVSTPPVINSITFTNRIDNHAGIMPLFTLYSGSAYVTNTPIKICADGSVATFIKVNVSNISGVGFRIVDENGNPINDADKYGHLGNVNVFGNNIEIPYTHPQYMNASGSHRNLTLQVMYNNSPISGINFPLNIYRAPVLMIHGWLGGLSSFEDMDAYLLQQGYIWPLTYRKTYPNSASFNDNINAAYDGIIDLFSKVRSGKISCGKVDIIAHSMGGILSRLYLQSTNYKNDIHKLITLNTPHSGTQGANFIYDIGNVMCPLLEWINIGEFICSPAVENMRVNSNSIRNQLNGFLLNRHVVPSFSISTEDIFATDIDCYSIGVLLYTGPYGLVDFLLIQSIFNFEGNDLVVPISSQQGGLSKFQHFTAQCHLKSSRNPVIKPFVFNLLNVIPSSQNFDINGYSPTILNSIYSPVTNQATTVLQPSNASIAITSPHESDTFSSGQTISIQTIGSTTINKTIIAVGNSIVPLFSRDTLASSTITSYTIPANASGKIRISCAGFDTVSQSFVIDTVQIRVNTSSQLDSITSYPDTLRIPYHSQSQLPVIGFYQDGVNRDLSENDSVSYIISDTTIVKYVNKNIFFGSSIGITNIVVLYYNKMVQVPVLVYPSEKIASAIFKSDKKIICTGKSVSFDDISIGTAISRVWYFEGGIPNSSTDVSPIVTYSIPGKYRVKLIVNFVGGLDSLVVDSLIEVYRPNTTISSGSWSNPLIWSCGSIPSDTATISFGHTVILDSSKQIKSLNVEAGGAIFLGDSSEVLTIGEHINKTGSLTCHGSLNISCGNLKVNGKLSVSGLFNMTGGKIIIDGNTGIASASIPDGQHLFNIATVPGNFNFSGGTLQIVNPPLGVNSQAINCPYNFGRNSTLYFGDGVSTINTNNPNGFGGNLLPAQIGRMIFDPATFGSNRIFKNLNPLYIQRSLDVRTGNLVQNALVKVADSIPLLLDIDGNQYTIAEFCNKKWAAQNLSVSHYRNGDTILHVQDSVTWANLTTGAWCYYQNNTANGVVYGKLYNWYAVNDSRGLAPAGWHIATDAEWTTMADSCLGGANIAAEALKSTGLLSNNTGLWLGSFNTATNSTGFTGLPAGCRLPAGGFVNLNAAGMWWSGTPASTTTALYREADIESNELSSASFNRKLGLSVRCVKD
jgi:uncharacterized protein (TIGR02145 family)